MDTEADGERAFSSRPTARRRMSATKATSLGSTIWQHFRQGAAWRIGIIRFLQCLSLWKPFPKCFRERESSVPDCSWWENLHGKHDYLRFEFTPASRPVFEGARIRSPRMIDFAQIKFTPRDREILDWLLLGMSNKEIAAKLSISDRTVKQHLRTIFLRAGISEGRKRVRLATAAIIAQRSETQVSA